MFYRRAFFLFFVSLIIGGSFVQLMHHPYIQSVLWNYGAGILKKKGIDVKADFYQVNLWKPTVIENLTVYYGGQKWEVGQVTGSLSLKSLAFGILQVEEIEIKNVNYGLSELVFWKGEFWLQKDSWSLSGKGTMLVMPDLPVINVYTKATQKKTILQLSLEDLYWREFFAEDVEFSLKGGSLEELLVKESVSFQGNLSAESMDLPFASSFKGVFAWNTKELLLERIWGVFGTIPFELALETSFLEKQGSLWGNVKCPLKGDLTSILPFSFGEVEGQCGFSFLEKVSLESSLSFNLKNKEEKAFMEGSILASLEDFSPTQIYVEAALKEGILKNFSLDMDSLGKFYLQGWGREENQYISSKGEIDWKETFQILIEDLEFVSMGAPLKNKDKLFLEFMGEGAVFHPCTFCFGEVPLVVKGSFSFEGGVLDVSSPFFSLDKYPLSFKTFSLKGDSAFKANISWNQQKSFSGDIEWIFRDIAPLVPHPVFPVSGSIHGNFDFKQAFFAFSSMFSSKETIQGSFVLASPLNQNFFNTSLEDILLEGSLKGRMEISPLVKNFLSDRSFFSGLADFKGSLAGSFKDPEFTYNLALRDGNFEMLNLNILIQNIDLLIEGDLNSCQIAKGVGYDVQGKPLYVTGACRLDEDKLPFYLSLDAKEFRFTQLEYLKTDISGLVAIEGNVEGMGISGELQVNRLQAHLPQEAPPLFKSLEIRYRQGEKKPRLPFEIETDPWPVSFDINLVTEKEASLRGEGFSSTWAGGLYIGGTTLKPFLSTKLKLKGGSLLFNGETWPFTEGLISFETGALSRKNQVYLVATHSTDEGKFDLVVSGPLHDPELSFRSTPPHSTEEILSYLLFHKSFENNGLAHQSYFPQKFKLSDPRLKGSFLDQMRKTTGLDKLEIVNKKDNEFSFRIGKYLSKKLLLSVGKNLATNVNEASIEAELPHHFKASGEISENAEGHIRLRWERDY